MRQGRTVNANFLYVGFRKGLFFDILLVWVVRFCF